MAELRVRPAHRPAHGLRPALAAAAAGALLMAGCTSDADDDAGGTPTAPAPSESVTQTQDPATTPDPNPGTGTASADQAVTIDPLTGQQTTLELAGPFAQVLRLGQVEVAAAAPAEGSGSAFSFPVTGGRASLDQAGSPSGTVQHGGGLQLTAAGQSLTAQDFEVDLAAGTLTADVAGVRIPLLSLVGTGTPQVQPDGRVVIDGLDATLTGEASQALEDRLGIPLPETSLGEVQVVLTGE